MPTNLLLSSTRQNKTRIELTSMVLIPHTDSNWTRRAGRLFIVFVFVFLQLQYQTFQSLSPTTTPICPTATLATTPGRNDSGAAVSEREERHAVVFACNDRYASAAASSVASVRMDGGYNGDIIVIIDNDVGKTNMTQMIIEHGGVMDDRIILLEASELFDSLLLEHNATTMLDYLREPPTPLSCLPGNRLRGRKGYYLKTLVFHPWIARQWDKILCKFYDVICANFHAEFWAL